MEIIKLNKNNSMKNKDYSKNNYNDRFKFIIIKISIVIFILILLNCYYLLSEFIINKNIYKNGTSHHESTSINYNDEVNLNNFKIFDENIKKYCMLKQEQFCKNPNIYSDELIENMIKPIKIKANNSSFYMFVYINNDGISESISQSGYWEIKETNFLLDSLLFYSQKRNIPKEDIYILDIGANIGWYSLIFGKNGYNILSFEPSKFNYYILRKNYCLNPDINMTIINRGLDITENKSTLYHYKKNRGNGLTFSDPQLINSDTYIKEEIKLSKLTNYIGYLKSKNLALIKIDIEGGEGKAFESGIDLITEYHIPFIFLEFTPKYLRSKGTDPKIFLEIFVNNGYKLCKNGFFNKEYYSIDQLLGFEQKNIYLIYYRFLE